MSVGIDLSGRLALQLDLRRKKAVIVPPHPDLDNPSKRIRDATFVSAEHQSVTFSEISEAPS